jgi:leucyl aminopeptidase
MSTFTRKAVALAYGKNPVPVVTAKGEGALAQQMIDAAIEAGVPVMQNIPLAHALFDAGEAVLDPCWRLPLDDDYAEGLKSNFADVANVAGREGGAITAAKFLQRFAKDFPWAHLDIAGSAWKSGAAKGATGRPVGLLLHYLLSSASTSTKPTRRSAKA